MRENDVEAIIADYLRSKIRVLARDIEIAYQFY